VRPAGGGRSTFACTRVRIGAQSHATPTPRGTSLPRNKILLVDDEPAIRFALRDFLETKGYDVEQAETCQAAQEVFRATRPDAVILDYILSDGNAVDLLPRLKAIDSGAGLIVLTGHGSIDLAVRAVKEGADHFLTKPVELPALQVILERVIDQQRSRRKEIAGRQRPGRPSIDPFMGTSAAIRGLYDQVRRVLSADSPILLQGETGSGKGVLSRWLHDHSPRADEAFVDVSGASFSKEFLESELFGHEKGAFTGAATAKQGLLEIAHRGTVFLDEIGDVDPQVQPKLLKVLEEKRFRRLGDVRDRTVDIRLIAATHHDLKLAVAERRFRSDLYFRISSIPLMVPPLRTRTEDIPLLADHLLAAFAPDLGRSGVSLSKDAVAALQSYPWPGNIRELRNVLERAVLLADDAVLERRDLRFEMALEPARAGWDTSLTLRELERLHIERVLQEEHGKVEASAKRLGVPRSTLYQKIKEFGIATEKH
jgi:DNA-binding NtrC family response regulator